MMKMLKKVLVFMLVAVLLLSIPAAQAKTYKASKVTAKQIVTELKKMTGYIKSTSKPDIEAYWYSEPNYFKSKYNFIDKKYDKVYCSVEVFRDNYDAARRQAYMDTLNYLKATFEWEEDVPTYSYRYKNVVIRFGSTMDRTRAIKYYKTLQKIIK